MTLAAATCTAVTPADTASLSGGGAARAQSACDVRLASGVKVSLESPRRLPLPFIITLRVLTYGVFTSRGAGGGTPCCLAPRPAQSSPC